MEITLSKRKIILLLGLSLIPLIGGIVGIVLVILGWNQKKKLLFKIGVLGIVFTIVVYTIIYFIGQSFYDPKKVNIRLSHKVLSELKYHVEDYKNKYGKYPESLDVLTKTNEMILINDPILFSKKNRNIKTTFEYSTKDGKYKLFSVGIDGIPNTKDDIYP